MGNRKAIQIEATPFGPHFLCSISVVESSSDDGTEEAEQNYRADDDDDDDAHRPNIVVDAAARVAFLHRAQLLVAADGSSKSLVTAEELEMFRQAAFFFTTTTTTMSSSHRHNFQVTVVSAVQQQHSPASSRSFSSAAGAVTVPSQKLVGGSPCCFCCSSSPRLAAFLFLSTKVTPPVTPRCDAAGFGAAFACYRSSDGNDALVHTKGGLHSIALVWTHVAADVATNNNSSSSAPSVRPVSPSSRSCSLVDRVERSGMVRLARSVKKAAWFLQLTPRRPVEEMMAEGQQPSWVDSVLGGFNFELTVL